MGKRSDRYIWNGLLGPRNKRLFKWRINNRVRWLKIKRWWKQSSAITGFFKALGRPALLLLIGIGLPLLIITFIPIEGLIELKTDTGQKTDDLTIDSNIGWRAIAQPLLILIGLPSAFILWAFRDYNARAALENQRKDINLKEFQEIQMRAAGAIGEGNAAAQQTLQIAAIHQLRPFLRGEYGASFRRPAWELLKARLATSAQETGYQAISDWVEKGGFPEQRSERAAEYAKRKVKEIREQLDARAPTPVTLAERALIAEEATQIFKDDLPLTAGRFGGIDLQGALLARLNLSRASFMRANLQKAHLEVANLNDAHLEGADLEGVHLEGADLIFAHMEGANLNLAHLEGAHLIGAHLEGADMRGVHLDDETNLTDAQYDDSTIFADGWKTLSDEEKDKARKPWRDRGARHVDEIKAIKLESEEVEKLLHQKKLAAEKAEREEFE